MHCNHGITHTFGSNLERNTKDGVSSIDEVLKLGKNTLVLANSLRSVKLSTCFCNNLYSKLPPLIGRGLFVCIKIF